MRASDAELPFAERLRLRAQEWAQVSGVLLDLADLELADLPSLPAAHEEVLLRIADEALANVLRHSGASRASIALRREADVVSLQIMDNGCGMSDEARPGMGLNNMRERAESLPEGRFDFVSAADRGTRVTIHFAITGSTPA